MKYDVFVQDIFYKTIENENNIAKIIQMVGTDIKNGLVSNFNNAENENIKIIRVEDENSSEYFPGSRIIGEDGSVQKLEK